MTILIRFFVYRIGETSREIVITCETRMESLKRFCLLDLPQGIEKRDHQGITIPTLIQGVNHLTT